MSGCRARGATARQRRDWRSRVIWQTNRRTSYAAGRYAQMKAVAEDRPFWRYRHSPASEEPRHDHLAWDGLVLRHDDPWWSTHLPPNGWGCKCYVETLDADDMERLGKEGPDAAPATRTRRVTVGRGAARRTVEVPEGIDPGFAYAPGARSQAGEAARHAIEASITQAPSIAAAAIAPMLARPRMLRDLGEQWRRWRRREPGYGADRIALGALSPQAVEALGKRGDTPGTATVTIDRRALGHMTRDAKRARASALADDDLDRLPEIIARPKAVLFEEARKGPTLLYVFDPLEDTRRGKIAVRVNFATAKGKTNAVRTAGYVKERDLRDQRHTLIEGSLE